MNFKSGTQIWMWDRCYGRDGDPTPTELSERVLVETANNVDLQLSALPKRRAGSSSVLFGGVLFQGFVKLGRFFGRWEIGGPIDEYLFWTDTLGEQYWARFIGTPSAGKAVPVPSTDVFQPTGIDAVFCQFNGKMYKAGETPVDRLHVMDRNDPDSPTAIRRVGLQAPLAPGLSSAGGVVPPGGGGLRYYRIQYKVKNTPATVTRRQSNLGDPAGLNEPNTARVTPSAPVAGEAPITHWVVYGSADNALYYNISGDLPMSTTFWDDTIGPGLYANYEAAPIEGSYNTWPSVKYLLSGIDRLIGFGAHFGQPMRSGNYSTTGRLWFSPVLSTSNTDDDERVPVQPAGSNPLQYWIDVGRGTGAEDRGLGGPIDGNVLVFQSRGVYLLVPTGNVYAPFKRVTISTDVGAVEGSIFTGQDELGRPAVYWVDENSGPWRYGPRGMEWLGYDVRDEWMRFNRTAPEFRRAHGVFHNETQTAFFWICQSDTVGTGTPNRLLRFNARLGKDTGPTGVRFGWTTDSGAWATVNGSVIARRSALGVGAAARATFQPIVSTGPLLLIRDLTQITDAGTGYTASVRSKVVQFTGAPFQIHQLITDWLYLQAVRSATPLQITLWRNYIDQLANAFMAVRRLDPPLQSAETRVLVRYEGLLVQDAYALQVELSDQNFVAATANWDIDFVALPVELRTQERWNVS